ncbi:MAG: carboxypeptidase-like regulatory domain-containing protein [Salinivirgaceae bacterium]|nr:carboxypeptidase-like regulatory domain-containing protein [Salinivirgaceae bacterium]
MLLFIGFIVFPKTGNAQEKILDKKVSLNIHNISIDQALDKLSEQCNCYFTYNASELNGEKVISILIKNKPLKFILDTIINNSSLVYQEIKNQIVIHPKLSRKIIDIADSIKSIRIFGVIRDAESKNPLPFATVTIKGYSLGSVSNDNGEFQLSLPVNFIDDTLTFSYLGYFDYSEAINTYSNGKMINLEPGIISIQEVLVRSIDPLALMQKARNLIQENNYTKHYNYEAFYRESVKRNSRVMVYSEALLNGYKPSMYFNGLSNKTELVKGRTFKNLQLTDTVLVKLRGGIETCFQLDLIHQVPDFIDEKGEELYDYSLSDIITWENQLVYVISFKSKGYEVGGYFVGDIYISVDDYAIVGADFQFSPEYMKRNKNTFVVKKSRSITVIPQKTAYKAKYHKYNGKYYTQHVRGELKIKVRKRNKLFSESYSLLMEMIYTQIDTLNPEKPKRRNVIQTHSVFSDSKYIYDASYWEKQNAIKPENDIIEAFQKSGFKVQENDNQ